MKEVMKQEGYSKMSWKSSDELYFLFDKAITDFKNEELTKKEFFDILEELTIRQVDTYENIKQPLLSRLDSVLCNLWNTESYEDVDTLTSLIINLGLKNTYKKMVQSINDTTNISSKIIEDIEEAIKEIGDYIEDPYHEYMKKHDENR